MFLWKHFNSSAFSEIAFMKIIGTSPLIKGMIATHNICKRHCHSCVHFSRKSLLAFLKTFTLPIFCLCPGQMKLWRTPIINFIFSRFFSFWTNGLLLFSILHHLVLNSWWWVMNTMFSSVKGKLSIFMAFSIWQYFIRFFFFRE